MVPLRAAAPVMPTPCAVVLAPIPRWKLVPVRPGLAPAQMGESLAQAAAGIQVASRAAALLQLLSRAAQTKQHVGPPAAAKRRV